MPTTDFSQVPDDQMEHIFGLLEDNADFIPNVDERRAFVAEYFRRKRGGAKPAGASAAPNVQSNLDASATPIPVEPVAGARGQAGVAPLAGGPSQADLDDALGFPTKHRAAAAMAVPGGGLGVRNTPEDLATYGEVVRDAYGRIIDRGVDRRQAARRQGYQDPEQAAYYADTGVTPSAAPMGDTVMVEGVEVPIHRDSLGNPMYDSQGRPMTTIGAERRAKEAADEARIVERVSREAQEEMQRYGDGTLQFYRYDPESAAVGVRNVDTVSPNEWDARFQQIHGRPMTEDERKLAAQQAANLEQRRGMEERQANQNAMLRRRPGLKRLEDQRAWSRNFIQARNLLAGGAQNINSGNVGFWNRLAMLSPEDQMAASFPGLAQMRADVEKANLERAAALAARGIQGALAGAGMGPLDAARAQLALDQADVQRDEARRPDEDVLGAKYAPDRWGPQFISGYDEFTIEEQQQMYDDLIKRGYKPAEAQAAVDRQAVKRRATNKMDWGG